MGYRSNLGCLWLLLLILLIGGTPLLVGVLRVFLAFLVILGVGGYLLSWWIRYRAVDYYTRSQTEDHNHFVELLVALITRLAEMDGELDRREVTAIRNFFQHRLGYQDERLLWIRDLIKASRGSKVSVEELCGRLRSRYGLQERLIVVQLLNSVAQADGRVTVEERRFVERVTVLLGLGDFVGGFGFGREPEADPEAEVDKALGTLGLSRGAGKDDMKAAWRRLSLENHPDRVRHLGPEFRRIAEEKMKEINKAWETLKAAGLAT
ncbi:MAG: TerB family tellurite resistance protein [Candidatus Binatia bacterium]